PVSQRDPPEDHRGALGLVREGRGGPANGAQAPRMRALACAVLGLLLWPAVAGAHATVVRTTPAATSVVRTAPPLGTMRFSEPVDLGPDSLRLLDATGSEIHTGKAPHVGGDRSTAQLALPGGLKNGTYVVAWRVTSADSHPVSGAFSFSIGAPSSL